MTPFSPSKNISTQYSHIQIETKFKSTTSPENIHSFEQRHGEKRRSK